VKKVSPMMARENRALKNSSRPETPGAIPAEVVRSDFLDCACFPEIGQDRSRAKSRQDLGSELNDKGDRDRFE
jgi:hypothetical protein